MRRSLWILAVLIAFVCTACNAVTPGPVTTRNTVPVATTAAVEEETTTAAEETTAAPETTAETTAEETEAAETKEDLEALDGDWMEATAGINVRDAASVDSNVVGSLMEGDTVKMIDEEGSWAVIIYEGERCYAAKKYLEYAE